jgi:hyperosmotically inducible protein
MKKTTWMMAALAGGTLLAPRLASADDYTEELQTKVESRLAHDPQLRDNRVSVTVDDEGIVQLNGKVDNAGEKSRATRLAMSAGAKRIENNLELATQPTQTATDNIETKAKSAAREVSKEVNDTWITSKVKTEIALDKGLGGSDISVDTNQNGVVTLTGTVPNEAERQRAMAVTRSVTGVREVKDALTVTAQKN